MTDSRSDDTPTIRQDFIRLGELLELLLSVLLVVRILVRVPPEGQFSVPATEQGLVSAAL